MIRRRTIAVFLAAYNGVKWIDEQINSILNQSGVSVRIFVSVDLSEDGTNDYLIEKSKGDKRIELLPYGRKFGSAAKNFFRIIKEVNISEFDYVAFADQDDIWLPDKLIKAVALISRNSCDGYSSSVMAFWNDGRKILINKAQQQVRWDYLFESAGPGCTFVLSNKLAVALQNFIIDNSLIIEKIWQHDWFIYAFARCNDYAWIIDPNPYMQYRQHTRNVVGANVGINAFLYRVRFVLSGRAFLESRIIAEILSISDVGLFNRLRRLNRIDFLFLAINAASFRRKYADKFFFFFVCIYFAILGLN